MAGTTDLPSADPLRFSDRNFEILSRRSEFLLASRADWNRQTGLVLQGRRRDVGEGATGMRVGFTCSKKVGNAVARNRAKRRLRAAAREIIPRCGCDGWDYVLIGKRDATAERRFDELCSDLEAALRRVHSRGARR